MPNISTLTVTLVADISQFVKNLGAAMRQVQGAMDRAAPASKALLGGITALGASMAGLGLAGVRMAAEMEQSRMAFATLLGSAQEADQFLRDLAQFAAKTPFELPGLQDASRKLLAFGFEAKQIIPMMTAIGDAVGALGGGAAEIDRVTYALGQMRAKGKVSAEEMMQLAELGIPAWEMLAQKIGVSIPEAMEMASKGAIPAAQGIEAILQGMTQRFGGAMEKQSQTILGRWSTMQDNLSMMLRTVGEEIIETFDLGGILGRLNEQLSRIAEVIEQKGLRQALAEAITPEMRTTILLVAGAIAGALVPALYSLASGFIAATLPLLPFMAAGAAVAGLAYLIYQNWSAIAPRLGALWEQVRTVAQPALDAMREAIGQLVAYVREHWPQIRQTLQTFFDWMVPVFRFAFGIVKDTVLFYIGVIVNIIKGFVNVVTGIIKLFSSILAGDWRGAWEAVKQIVSGALQALWGLFQLWIIGRITALFQRALSGILSGVMRFGTNLLSHVTGFLGRIGTTVSGWLTRAVGWFSSTWTNITGATTRFGTNIVSSVSSALGRLGSAVLSGLGKVKSFFTQWVKESLDELLAMGSRLFEIGKTLVQSLWDGIASLAGWLRSKLASFARTIIPGPIADALGIHSPSKVMMAFGAEIARGLAEGMKRNVGEVAAAAASLAAAVGAPAGLRLGPSVPPVVAAGTVGGAAAGFAPVQIGTVHVTVQARDLREVEDVLDLFRNLRQAARAGV